MDSSFNSSDPNPSFAFRSTTQNNNNNNNNNNFLRSHSTKETVPFSNLLLSPQHLSCPTLSRSLQNSPLHPQFSSSPTLSTTKLSDSDPQTTYHCASSVLRNDGQIISLALSSNDLVYTGSDSNVVRVWKLPEFSECGQLRTKACRVVALEVCNDTVYAAYGDGKIRVWRRTWDKVLKHVRLATIPKTVGYVRSYIVGKDKTMKHKGLITSMAINTAEDILYTASLDKTVKVWRISDLKCIETIKAHNEPINAIIVADDGVLYTASDDATVRVWRRNFCSHDQPHSLTVTLHAKHSPVKTLTLNPDEGILYGGCTDGYIHYWLKGWFAGQLQYGGSIQGHTHAVLCLASVAKYVVSGSADSTSRVWVREQDGQHTCVAVLVGHRGPIRCVTAFIGGRFMEENEDCCTVCSGSLDGVLKVWRVTHSNNVNNQCSSQAQPKYKPLQ
ncbi:putative transcription factor WD40-like family [Lupinus albus]|uniref:Putative transcription factor WD40-like family n=1 Tax=Lupinus albus TaxID=3870 RepID=A0A6A4N7V3_LUPAL|nr:putative transcription factor WD40-like family [Lupinus albus]